MERWRRIREQLRQDGRATPTSVIFFASFGGGAIAITLLGIGRLLAGPTGDRVVIGLVFVSASAGVAAICLLLGLRRMEGAARFAFMQMVLHFATTFGVLWYTDDLGWPFWQQLLTTLAAALVALAASFLFLLAYGRVPGAARNNPSHSWRSNSP